MISKSFAILHLNEFVFACFSSLFYILARFCLSTKKLFAPFVLAIVSRPTNWPIPQKMAVSPQKSKSDKPF
jgi:hypothetical protein